MIVVIAADKVTRFFEVSMGIGLMGGGERYVHINLIAGPRLCAQGESSKPPNVLWHIKSLWIRGIFFFLSIIQCNAYVPVSKFKPTDSSMHHLRTSFVFFFLKKEGSYVTDMLTPTRR